jgi:hypothetical protein
MDMPTSVKNPRHWPTLLRHCSDTARHADTIVNRHCPDTAPTLPRHCPDTAPTLPRHCPDTAPTLPRHCPDTAPTLPRLCPDTAPTLLDTPTLRHCRAQAIAAPSGESARRRVYTACGAPLLHPQFGVITRDPFLFNVIKQRGPSLLKHQPVLKQE